MCFAPMRDICRCAQAEVGLPGGDRAGEDDKDPASTGWTEDEAHDFLTAYHEHGLDWQKVYSTAPCASIILSPHPLARPRLSLLPSQMCQCRDADRASCLGLQIAEHVGSSKTAEDCETLFRQHRGYLTLNVEYHSDVVFATMVHDHFNTVPQKV